MSPSAIMLFLKSRYASTASDMPSPLPCAFAVSCCRLFPYVILFKTAVHILFVSRFFALSAMIPKKPHPDMAFPVIIFRLPDICR